MSKEEVLDPPHSLLLVFPSCVWLKEREAGGACFDVFVVGEGGVQPVLL